MRVTDRVGKSGSIERLTNSVNSPLRVLSYITSPFYCCHDDTNICAMSQEKLAK